MLSHLIPALIKPHYCPAISEVPESCVDAASECSVDTDCNGLKKCCANGCVRICVDSIYEMPSK